MLYLPFLFSVQGLLEVSSVFPFSGVGYNSFLVKFGCADFPAAR